LPDAVTGDLRLAVLDPDHDPSRIDAPLGLAALADAIGARWYRDAASVPDSAAAVLLVLGDAGLPRCRDILIALQVMGKPVLVTFARSGGMPIANLITSPEGLAAFFDICRLADAAVATTAESQGIFEGAGARLTTLIPAPCPVADDRWDVPSGAAERSGILVGTWNFAPHYFNHTAALLTLRDVSEQTAEPVTVVCADERFDRRMLRQVRRRWPARRLEVVKGPLPSSRLIGLAARHKLVFQLEWGGGMGEVAAAALLGRIPCVGGHGHTERIAFPDLCGFGRTTPELRDIAIDLLGDEAAAERAAANAVHLAAERLSPDRTRAQLGTLLDRASAGSGRSGSPAA
jgi:hypothetical protein